MAYASISIKENNHQEQGNLSAQPKFFVTNSPERGAATWTKRGEWIKETDQEKLRLILTNDRQTHIALKQDDSNMGFFQRIRNHLTHISIAARREDGSKEYLSVNIGSLSKRTKLSVATIFLLKLRGKLTLDYIQESIRKAHENNQIFENIIKNGRKRAVEDSQDPDEKEKTLKDVIRTVMKGRRLATGILVNRGESVYIAQKDKGLPLRLVEKRKLLGEGEYSTVHEVHNLAMGRLQAVKIAKETDPKGGAVKNENALLKWIHRNGHVKGIQDPPHFVIDLLDREDCVGYVTDKYYINLDNIKFLTETSLRKKIYGCLSLFNGADFLHKNGIVHCDFKPENFCFYNSEFQIADFGHAREIGKITLQHSLGPLGVSTPIFTSKADERENTRINQTYWMHRMAIHKVRSPLKQASILKSAIDDPRFNIDRKAAKRYIAFALINSKCSDMQINKIGFSRKELEKEIQKSTARNEKPLDLSQYELNENQLKQLKEDAIALCKRHDVYSFGLAILCILNGTRYIPPKKIKYALEKLLQNQMISPLNKDIVNLIENMLAKDSSKRPTLHEAHLKYREIAHQVS